MTEAATIVRVALGLLGVADANEAIEAEDSATAIRALNSMVAGWAIDGWDLGWVPVVNPTDVIVSPAWADETLSYNLAVRLGPHYGVMATPDVLALVQISLATMSAFFARKTEADDEPRVSYADYPAGVGYRGAGDGFGP